eukprot:5700888-Amphidinium_carterae.1
MDGQGSTADHTAKTVINYLGQVHIHNYFTGLDIAAVMQHLKAQLNDKNTNASEGRQKTQ